MRAWARLIAIIAVAAIGLPGAWWILSSPAAPRWLIALSGMIGMAGLAAAIVLIAAIVSVIIVDVRPSVRLRKPVSPMFLTQREASMIGHSRYRQHPICFWGILSLNSRFLIGFMLFSPVEYLDFKDPEEGEG